MTTVTGDYSNYDASYLSELASATLGSNDSTHFVLTTSGYTVTVTGTGFTYSGNGPNGGTITGISVLSAYDTTPTVWSNLSVPAATLWSYVKSHNVTNFNNLLYGGNDTFVATGTGGGAFSGWGGNDAFNMQNSAGPDFLSGGDGNDTFNYGPNFYPVNHIDGGAGNDVLNLGGGDANLGYVTNIELINLAPGANYSIEIGMNVACTVDGSTLGTNDSMDVTQSTTSNTALTVKGGAGNDTLVLGGGNVTFDGSGGSNTVSFYNLNSGVTVNLNNTGTQNFGAGTVTLKNVQNLVGSFYNDALTGNSQDNVFTATAGNDVINGGAGSDTVDYNTLDGTNLAGAHGLTFDARSETVTKPNGTDTLTSIEGIVGTVLGDTFIGNSSSNYFDAGGCINAAYDTIDYEYATGGVTITAASSDSSGKTLIATGGGQGTDTLKNFTQIIASSYDDTFYFLNSDTPYVQGGGGSDTISFAFASHGVYYQLGQYGAYQAQADSVETLVGSGYDDTLYGSSGNDTILGGAGNDTIYAAGIYGGGGTDLINGGGGGGTDTVQIEDSSSNYTITQNGTYTTVTGNGVNETLVDVEKIQFLNTTINLENHGATAADFDGSGHDGLVLQKSDGTVAVWLMNGATISSQATVGTPGSAWSVKGSADFNGDDCSDLVVQDTVTGAIALWFMNRGSVASSVTLSTNPGPSWQVVGEGDFNGDGYADLLLRNKTTGQGQVWELNGAIVAGSGLVGGTNLSGWRMAGTGDFNGDGKADVLLQNNSTGQTAIWLMNGTAISLGAYVGGASTAWKVVDSGDFNGDGKSDILLQNGSTGQVAVWLMNGTTMSSSAYVATPGAVWKAVSADDLNGDGKADIVLQNSTSGQYAVWTMNGAKITAGAYVSNNPGTSWQVANNGVTLYVPPVANDTNGDGKSDLVLQNSSTGQIAVWLMNGATVTSSANVGGALGTNWVIAGNGDFNLDGKSDLALQNSATGQVAVWLMNGTSLAGGFYVGTADPSWHVVTTADFNGDGKTDILLQNSNGQAAVWTMNGTARTGQVLVGGNPGTSWHLIGAGDLNGDGQNDLVWQSDNGAVTAWTMNGTAPTSWAFIGNNTSSSRHVKAVADFNGDGKSDLLLQDSASGQVAVWLLNGTTVASSADVGSASTTWQALRTGDYNGDGKADILLRNSSTGQDAIWFMNGTTLTSNVTVSSNPGTGWSESAPLAAPLSAAATPSSSLSAASLADSQSHKYNNLGLAMVG